MMSSRGPKLYMKVTMPSSVHRPKEVSQAPKTSWREEGGVDMWVWKNTGI